MSANYTIKTVWAWRNGEEGPELLDAWEEFAIDNNLSGWHEAVKKHAEFVADPSNDFLPFGLRIVDILVDFNIVEQMFDSEEIEGKVLPGAE